MKAEKSRYVGPGAGKWLNFLRTLFTNSGVDTGPRFYRNNL